MTEEFNQPIDPGSADETLAETMPLSEGVALADERDKLLNEKQELQDLLQRTRAEFANARRRAEAERADYIQYAGMELTRELLPVLDDFERALHSAGNLGEGPARDYIKGVELIYQRLMDKLVKQGLEPIVTAGQMFDPNLHQAIERVETKDHDDQTILGEFQRGYFFKGRLLRPSMVRVAVHP